MADLTQSRLADVFRIARASRYSAPENGGDALPIVYGDLTVPARTKAGVYTLPQIDTGGAGTWCVAGHAIAGSVSLFDTDGLIAPGDYTLNLANDFQGKGIIATAAFSAAPNGSVAAVCKGKKNAAGALIENPFYIVEDLMKNLWGFTDQDMDLQALSRVAQGAVDAGYLAAVVIENDRAPADVLTDLLGDFLGGFEVDALGRLRLALAGQEAGAIHPVKALPAAEAESVEIETSRDSVINQVPALYAKDYRDGRHISHEDGEGTKEAASQALYGVRLPESGRLDFDWVRTAAVARAVQARIIERFAAPARVVIYRDGTFRGLEAEPDDYVVFSIPWMRTAELEPLINQIGQVTEASPDLRSQSVEYRIRDTGFYLTKANLLDGSQTLGGGWLFGATRELEPVA
ncbi:MAG: hypothetical protein O2807_10395 [bacterium]|nr:hypothetical protein [bacterium]